MSKYFRAFFLTVLLLGDLYAQAIEAILHIDRDRSSIRVEGKFPEDGTNHGTLAFLSDYAGVRLPAERISNVKRSGDAWSYDVDARPVSHGSTAHLSWLAREHGVLMLADILPQTRPGRKQRAKISVNTSAPWTVVTKEPLDRDGSYLVSDVEKAVFFLGFGPASPADGRKAVFAGRFQFTQKETGEVIEEVFDRYSSLFRDKIRPPLVGLYKLTSQPYSMWTADTRGSTITIAASDAAFKSTSVQQLHEQLRHEMFHLWIPEGLALAGRYDWFYEGFALYQSLKLGVALNRLRFADYLDTLSRAYTVDLRLGGKASLIDVSRDRWLGDNNTVIYSRGMLFAFLCDLALLDASKGKRSTDDIVREVYKRHRGPAAEKDGNDAVIEVLNDHSALPPLVGRYVRGKAPLEWGALLSPAGLRAVASDGATTLQVVEKPSGSQKRVLDKLGYNNWRKLSPK